LGNRAGVALRRSSGRLFQGEYPDARRRFEVEAGSVGCAAGLDPLEAQVGLVAEQVDHGALGGAAAGIHGGPLHANVSKSLPWPSRNWIAAAERKPLSTGSTCTSLAVGS